MRWELCRKTHTRLQRIARALGFTHVDPSRIFCVRGYGSTSEAWARIWGLPTLWQQVLETRPAYVVEIIEPEFSRLPKDEQDRVLIHELLHIPRTFSGAIRPQFKKTEHGQIIVAYKGSYLNAAGNLTSDLQVNIQYNEVSGLEVPLKVSVEGTYNGGPVSMEIVFSDYQIRKAGTK